MVAVVGQAEFAGQAAPVRSRISMIDQVFAWSARRRAIRHLSGLDDHLLSDVGLERRDIPSAVRLGRAG